MVEDYLRARPFGDEREPHEGADARLPHLRAPRLDDADSGHQFDLAPVNPSAEQRERTAVAAISATRPAVASVNWALVVRTA